MDGLVTKLQADMARAEGLARAAVAAVSGVQPRTSTRSGGGGCGGASGNSTMLPSPSALVTEGSATATVLQTAAALAVVAPAVAAPAAAAMAGVHAHAPPGAAVAAPPLAGQAPGGGAGQQYQTSRTRRAGGPDQQGEGMADLVQQLTTTETGHWLAKVLTRAASSNAAPLVSMHLSLAAQQQQQEPQGEQRQPDQGGCRGFRPFKAPPSTASACGSLLRLHSQHQQTASPSWDWQGLNVTAAGAAAASHGTTHPHPVLPTPLQHAEVRPASSTHTCPLLTRHRATTRHAMHMSTCAPTKAANCKRMSATSTSCAPPAVPRVPWGCPGYPEVCPAPLHHPAHPNPPRHPLCFHLLPPPLHPTAVGAAAEPL